MKDEKTFRDLAIVNFKTAKTLRNDMKTKLPDELFLNVIAYHLEQAVEIWLKSDLEDNGVNYPKTHDIEQLLVLGEENNVNFNVTEYIKERSDMFTRWAIQTRYVINYKVKADRIDKAIEEIQKSFDMYYKNSTN